MVASETRAGEQAILVMLAHSVWVPHSKYFYYSTFMDWKLSSGTFRAIFVAEMGDKTQLAAFVFALASGGSSKWAVFIGASLALIATTAIAVLGAGALFIVMGILLLLAKSEGPSVSTEVPPQAAVE
jgi:putative Ca2+/H+ antiporter (TMEM165/GDT1 family)